VSPANPAIVERNRRAVYHALRNTFTEAELVARALNVWEAQFAQQGGFRISQYATAVAAELSLNDIEIRDLAAHLYASMTLTDDRLPRLTSMNGHAPAATGTQPRLDKVSATASHPRLDRLSASGIENPRTAVVAKLMDAMIDMATRERKLDDLVESLLLNEVPLSDEVARQRMVWINRKLADTHAFAARVPESDWRALVNDLYVALCDACGPASADRNLAQAVQATEQISEARMFSPRTLL
jgi:hypothetical protein